MSSFFLFFAQTNDEALRKSSIEAQEPRYYPAMAVVYATFSTTAEVFSSTSLL